jgi:hypothetical protein
LKTLQLYHHNYSNGDDICRPVIPEFLVKQHRKVYPSLRNKPIPPSGSAKAAHPESPASTPFNIEKYWAIAELPYPSLPPLMTHRGATQKWETHPSHELRIWDPEAVCAHLFGSHQGSQGGLTEYDQQRISMFII